MVSQATVWRTDPKGGESKARSVGTQVRGREKQGVEPKEGEANPWAYLPSGLGVALTHWEEQAVYTGEKLKTCTPKKQGLRNKKCLISFHILNNW